MRLGHRVSYDVDLFYRSADAFDRYDPNKSPTVKALIQRQGGSWQYPGSYLKLELKMGEIDILIFRFMTP